MKNKIILVPALAAVVLIFSSVGAFAARTEAGTRLSSGDAQPVIEKGMDADAIRTSIGKPNEIRPLQIAGQDLKTEKWIYRRKAKENTVQTVVGQNVVGMMVSDGTWSHGGHPTTPRYTVSEFKLKRVALYQVTAMLMVDDKLVLAKQWMEKDESFVD